MSMHPKKKKHIIKEAFDFNNQDYNTDNDSFEKDLILDAVYIDNFINNKQKLLIDTVQYTLKCNLLKSHFEKCDKDNNGILLLKTYPEACSFLLLNQKHFHNIPFGTAFKTRYKEVIQKYCSKEYENIKDNKNGQAYISNDNGIIIFVFPPKYHLGYYNAFLMFSGNVIYEKPKASDKLISYMWDYFIKKYCGSSLKTYANNGFSIVYDRFNYPMLSTVITTDNLYRNLPGPFYSGSKCSHMWTKRLQTTNPYVKLRRDTNDELLQFGLFYPWNIKGVYKDQSYSIFNRYSVGFTDISQDLNNEDKNNIGCCVIQLSPKAKAIYDQLQIEFANKTTISTNKVAEFFDKFNQ